MKVNRYALGFMVASGTVMSGMIGAVAQEVPENPEISVELSESSEVSEADGTIENETPEEAPVVEESEPEEAAEVEVAEEASVAPETAEEVVEESEPVGPMIESDSEAVETPSSLKESSEAEPEIQLILSQRNQQSL